jgi:hypothetical protein
LKKTPGKEIMIYNVAFGGLFALAFALAYGRMGDFAPRATAAVLAVLGIGAGRDRQSGFVASGHFDRRLGRPAHPDGG